MSKKAFNPTSIKPANDGKTEWSNKFSKYNEWSKKATQGLANKAVGKPQYSGVKSKGVVD